MKRIGKRIGQGKRGFMGYRGKTTHTLSIHVFIDHYDVLFCYIHNADCVECLSSYIDTESFLRSYYCPLSRPAMHMSILSSSRKHSLPLRVLRTLQCSKALNPLLQCHFTPHQQFR